MEEDSIIEFRAAVIQGEYDRARKLLKWGNVPRAEYILYEQEYLELVERGQRLEAIRLMQKELMPRVSVLTGGHPESAADASSRLHELAQLIMIKTGEGDASEELKREAKWAGSGPEGR